MNKDLVSYNLSGSYSNFAGRKLSLFRSINNNIPNNVVENFRKIENFFKQSLNYTYNHKDQILLTKFGDLFIIYRFRDNFTRPDPSRVYERNEIYFIDSDKFNFWNAVNSFLESNPIKNYESNEIFLINDFEVNFIKRIGEKTTIELINFIQFCLFDKYFVHNGSEDESFSDACLFLSSFNIINELAFIGYNLKILNFNAFSRLNIVFSSDVEPVSIEKNILIEEVVQKLFLQINEIKIPEDLKIHKDYHKRINWLLQYKYCELAIGKKKLESAEESQIKFVFDLCNKLLEDEPFDFAENFYEKIFDNQLYFIETHSDLFEKIKLILPEYKNKDLDQDLENKIKNSSIEQIFSVYAPRYRETLFLKVQF